MLTILLQCQKHVQEKWVSLVRSSRSEVFCKKGVLNYFTKCTWKHLWQSLFFNKVAGLSLQSQKRDSGTDVFLWILLNFYKQLFSKNTSGGCFCFVQVWFSYSQNNLIWALSKIFNFCFCFCRTNVLLVWNLNT